MGRNNKKTKYIVYTLGKIANATLGILERVGLE